MTKHIIDRQRIVSDTSRVKAYVALEREDTPHPASRTLMRRSAERHRAGERVKAFLNIERGYTA
jgi:hypothetical protein